MQLTTKLAATLPPDELHRVQDWLDDLCLVADASNKEQIKAIIAQKHGCSVSKVTQYYYGVKKHGAGFIVDGRRQRGSQLETGGHRSPQFRQWVHSLYYKVKRNNPTPEVQRLMLEQLNAWIANPSRAEIAIPGYQSPPPLSKRSRYRYPTGWSQRNLNAMKPDGYQALLGRHGPHKARELLPSVFTTRVGLKVGEVYMLDDQYLDLMVHYGDKPVRPIGLNMLDYFSGCDVDRILRPLLKDEDDGNRALTQKDAVWLTVSMLTFTGYNPDRCFLVAESGSASYPEFFKKGISAITEKKVIVEIGEVGKRKVAGLRMIAKGNPRFKASRESWFNILRNRMAALPMQTGKDRDSKPEETIRLEQEERALLKDAAKLPAEMRGLIQTEGLTWHELGPVYFHICELINQRTEHSLEGWEELGFEQPEFLIGDVWVDRDEYQDLAPETRAIINARMMKGETVSRMRRKSPREVFETGAPQLAKISPFDWHYVVPVEYAIPAKIPANRTITIDRHEYGPGKLIFEPSYRTQNNEERPVPAGEKVLLYINPIRPDFALMCSEKTGKSIGVVFAVSRGTRTDKNYMLEQFQKLNAIESQIGGTAAVHNSILADQRETRRKQNRAILEEHGIKTKKTTKKKDSKKSKNPLSTLDIPEPKKLSQKEEKTAGTKPPSGGILDL